MIGALALGADPGESTGIAAVLVEPGKGPRLLGLAQAWGSTRLAWWTRCSEGLRSLLAILDDERRDGLEIPPVGEVRLYIEAIPATLRKGSIEGVTDGHKAWAGLGEYRGSLRITAYQVGLVHHQSIEQGDWTRALKVAPKKLESDPELRIREASAIVRGAKGVLDGLPSESQAARNRKIDAAESILIAAAGAVIEFQKLACVARRGV